MHRIGVSDRYVLPLSNQINVCLGDLRRLTPHVTEKEFRVTVVGQPRGRESLTILIGASCWCCRIRTWRVPYLRGRSRGWGGRLGRAAGNRPDCSRAEWLLRR